MQNSPITPTIGRVVLFVPTTGSKAANESEIAPAVIVKINEDGTLNLKVWTNHQDDEWHKDVPYSEAGGRGTWAWPENEFTDTQDLKGVEDRMQVMLGRLLGSITRPTGDMTLDDVKNALAGRPAEQAPEITEEQEVAVFTRFVEWLRGEAGSNAEGMIDVIDEYLESRWGGSTAQAEPLPEVTDPATPQVAATGQTMEPITGTGQDDVLSSDTPAETPAEPTPETPKEEPEAKAQKGKK